MKYVHYALLVVVGLVIIAAAALVVVRLTLGRTLSPTVYLVAPAPPTAPLTPDEVVQRIDAVFTKHGLQSHLPAGLRTEDFRGSVKDYCGRRLQDLTMWDKWELLQEGAHVRIFDDMAIPGGGVVGKPLPKPRLSDAQVDALSKELIGALSPLRFGEFTFERSYGTSRYNPYCPHWTVVWRPFFKGVEVYGETGAWSFYEDAGFYMYRDNRIVMAANRDPGTEKPLIDPEGKMRALLEDHRAQILNQFRQVMGGPNPFYKEMFYLCLANWHLFHTLKHTVHPPELKYLPPRRMFPLPGVALPPDSTAMLVWRVTDVMTNPSDPCGCQSVWVSGWFDAVTGEPLGFSIFDQPWGGLP